MGFKLIFRRRFSMAHRLISGSSKKCSVPHGHNEMIRVFLQAKQSKPLDGHQNMVEIFENLKKKWHDFIDNHIDHAFQLSQKDPLINFFKDKEKETLKRIVITPGDPTTEMLCACLMSKLQVFLDGEGLFVNCTKIEIEETPTNMVSLQGEKVYLHYLPTGSNKTAWWTRNDFSINDF